MNETVRNARQAALDALQPSARDLEYGLGLHRECLVIDAYGFGPSGLVRADRLNPLLEQHASPLEIQDAREHESMTSWATDDALFAEAAAAWETAGVDCIWINAGEESSELTTLFKRLARRSYAAELRRDFLTRAYQPDDIEAAHRAGRRCIYPTANGVPLPQRYVSVPDEVSFIRPLFQLGTRMAHLTYNRANLIGGGCGETNDAGLTDLGRAVVGEMNRVGMIVDVAHSGLRTSLDAARCSTKPMVASHTVCHALSPHIRAKTDEVIRAIADTDGFVGICCIANFLGRTWDIRALLDHVDHVAKTCGARHVAIGTDVAYTPTGQAAENAKLLPAPRSREHWRSLWPAGSLSLPPNAPRSAPLTLAWTNFPLFTVGLVQRGYTDDQIRQILSGNCLRVARALWDHRDP